MFTFALLSCKSKENINVNLSINKKDSTLIIRYNNPNSTDYYIDFIPEFNNSSLKTLPEGGSKFDFEFVSVQKNNDDSLNFKKLNCVTYSKYEKEYTYQSPIFLKSNSSKTYKFKITDYRSGSVIKHTLENPYKSFLNDMKSSNSTDEVNKLIALESCKCNNYKYFVGDFIFNAKKIILP